MRRLNDSGKQLEVVDDLRKGILDVFSVCEAEMRGSGTFVWGGGKGVRRGVLKVLMTAMPVKAWDFRRR